MSMSHQAVEPDFKEDPQVCPYQEYARLREECPVPRVRRAIGLEPFLVTRYQDAKDALADPRLSKNAEVAREALEAAGLAHVYLTAGQGLAFNMLTSDPPSHTRQRRMLAAEFTPRRITMLRPRVQELADQLVDDLLGAAKEGRRADLIGSFASQLPALVIAELLGVPSEDREQFRTWADHTMRPAQDPAQRSGLLALNEYLARQIELKRAAPGEDLISALIQNRDEDRLDDDELLGATVLLLVAGHETTVNLIGNGMLALLQHPDQLALLRERPELIPGAIDEFLRYDGPVERATARYAAQDMEIAGTRIPAGSVVMVALSSADRDESAFAEPDRLDVTRSARGHLAFGHGIHFCLGATLAKMEGEIAFETLLRRLPDLALAVPAKELRYRPSTIMRGLESLPVTFTG
jgi:cytochrome P450